VDRTAGPEPRISVGDVAGTVTVAAPTQAPLDEAWRALTESARIEQWFGAVSGEPAPGARLRLDFGDGDFFDLEVQEVARPVLRWTWRFMGCAPRNDVEVGLAAGGDGRTVVTIRDSEPYRDREAALELGEGWRDFARRLQRHLATGERTRYPWRGEVDVPMEMPVGAATARQHLIPAAAEWLPLDGGRDLFSAGALILGDGDEWVAFEIEGVEPDGPGSVRFAARPEGYRVGTRCRIAIEPYGEGSVLSIRHVGFEELDAVEATARRLRERWAQAWLHAAWRARGIVDREPAPSSMEPARRRR
jgi:uncharacterized protein YndB with AHSA1/START domain